MGAAPHPRSHLKLISSPRPTSKCHDATEGKGSKRMLERPKRSEMASRNGSVRQPGPLVLQLFEHLRTTCRGQAQGGRTMGSASQPPRPGRAPRSGCPCLWQCSSTCGKGLQSRVVQCMHKVTGRHGNECPALSKPAAYRQCYQEACNDKINVNTITSPRLGECLCWPPLRRGAPCPGQPVPAGGGVP